MWSNSFVYILKEKKSMAEHGINKLILKMGKNGGDKVNISKWHLNVKYFI